MNLKAHDQPIAQRELVRDADVDRGMASLSRSGNTHQCEHPLRVNFPVTLRLEANRSAPRTDALEDPHSFHTPEHRLVRAYHRMLVWDITRRPLVLRAADRLLNPVLGKSLVVYLEKPQARP